MKNYILLILLLMSQLITNAQLVGESGIYSFSIKRRFDPPVLSFVPGSLVFKDEDGNQVINAGETFELRFKLLNKGLGAGTGLKVRLSASGQVQGINLPEYTSIESIQPGQQNSYILNFSSSSGTLDGIVELNLAVIEPNGFGTEDVQLEIKTKKFAEPFVQVSDFLLFGEGGSKQIKLGEPFYVQLLLQNVGQGVAHDVEIRFPLPPNVYPTEGDELINFPTLEPGEERSLEYGVIINRNFVGNTLKLNALISESNKKYSKNWTNEIQLNQSIASKKLIVDGKEEGLKQIEKGSLRADVDKDIPLGKLSKPNRYALIIGNEDYSSKQPGLSKESNVDFAVNDANVFAEYAEKVLGFPKENIKLLTDATRVMMSQGLDWLVKKSIAQEDAEILFYFSGHGLPNETTKEPFLIPVDVSGTNLKDAISLVQVYDELAKSESKKCLVVLDACFSGGARNKELIALKGIKVDPSINQVPGNLLVLASSSGEESSAVFEDKQHGYFTYYLLKNLRETKGESTIELSMAEISKKVKLGALDIPKEQTPQVLHGPLIENTWKSLKW